MKLYLTILGLFTIAVPDGHNGPVEVLFLDAGHTTTTEMAVPRHTLHLQYHVSAGEDGTGPPVLVDTKWNSPVDLRVGNDDPVTLVNPNGFLDLSEIVAAGEPLRLRADCAGRDALKNCQVDGHPALSARLVLGGGRLHPVEILLAEVFRTPAIPVAQDTWTFRPLGDPPAENDPRRTTFNGALFEMDIPAGVREVVLTVGDSRLPLRPHKLAQCLALSTEAGAADECIIVRLDNSVDKKVIETAAGILQVINNNTAASILNVFNDQYGTVLKPMRGSGVKINTDRGIDTHFQLIYPLLANQLPRERQLVPHINLTIGLEEPPESRCIPPLVQLPVQGDGL